MASSRRTGINENISTFGDGTRDYSVLATWESATDNNLISLTQSEVLEVYADTSTYTVPALLMAGAITNASYMRIIRAASGSKHGGSLADGVGVTFIHTGDSNIIEIQESYAKIQDLRFQLDGAGTESLYCIKITSNSEIDTELVGLIFYDCVRPGGYAGGVISWGTDTVVVDCVGIDNQTQFVAVLGGSIHVYNSIAIGNGQYAYYQGAGTYTMKNCISHDNVGADVFGTIDSSTTCLIGTANAPKYVDSANRDYTLSRYDVNALRQGTDLSTDATFPFADDIAGNHRPEWDIGAFFGQYTLTSNTSRRIGTNENITTYGSGGNNRDYTSLVTWESATSANLVALTKSEVLEVFPDEDTFDDAIAFSGATTSDLYFRSIRSATGYEPNGDPAVGPAFSSLSAPDGGLALFYLNENYCNISDLVIRDITHNTSVRVGFRLNNFGNYATAIGCIVSNVGNTGGQYWAFFQKNTCGVANCLAIDISASTNAYGFSFNGASMYAYNCTAVNCGDYGFHYVLGTVPAKNCDANGNGIDFHASITQTTCNDGGLPTYVDSDNNDYRIANADRVLRVEATDLTADGTHPFDDDIRFYRRKDYGNNWDIGAFENISSRRIGRNENIRTYGNGTREYTSLVTWESATDNNLAGSNISEVLGCYNDSASFNDGLVNITGATTSPSYFRTIRAAEGEGHGGDASVGVYFRRTSSVAYVFSINSTSEKYFQLMDLRLGCNYSSGSSAIGLVTFNAPMTKVIGCMVVEGVQNTEGMVIGLDQQPYVNGQTYTNAMVNNLVKGVEGYTSVKVGPGLTFGSTNDAYTGKCACYNNSVIDNTPTHSTYYGFDSRDTTPTDLFAKNIVVNGSGGAGEIDTVITQLSCTEDRPSFEDTTSYKLASDDTVAQSKGRNLTQDVYFPFDDDISGNIRGLTWDIGAHQYVALPPPEGGLLPFPSMDGGFKQMHGGMI